jgi:8-oxo-dGTP pyrophosphatase MutT (NUDIX family)
MHVDKVALVLLREGRVLSTRSRGKDTYYLPGGKREPGESDEDCVCR